MLKIIFHDQTWQNAFFSKGRTWTFFNQEPSLIEIDPVILNLKKMKTFNVFSVFPYYTFTGLFEYHLSKDDLCQV